MEDLARDGDLSIRLMKDDVRDCEFMAMWLTNPRVLEFYEGRDHPIPLDRIKEKYGPRVLGSEGVTPCLLIYGDSPIGYIQFYQVTEAMNTYGIDQFIGEPDLWNRGIGSRAVSLLLRYLFRDKGANKVILDPHVGNLRAIRCYEKCGFRKVRLLPRHELHEGEYRDSWLMEVTPDAVATGI